MKEVFRVSSREPIATQVINLTLEKDYERHDRGRVQRYQFKDSIINTDIVQIALALFFELPNKRNQFRVGIDSVAA